jgi:hypothetical protein
VPEPGAAAPTDCSLAEWRRATGGSIAPGSEQAPDSRLTKPEVAELRAEVVAVVEARAAAAAGSVAVHIWLSTEIDHIVSCWIITWLMHQFFGTRNLGDVSPADRLWLMQEIKKLHNGFKNAMLVDTSRNQWHIWLNLLIAMGFCLNDISSEERRARQPCVPRSAQHSHRPGVVIDFSPCFEPLSLAVDAATMLEGFHSYAQQLYLIGKEQEPGSNRQKVPFALAKWFFDAGDRARLTVSTGTPP